MSRLDDLPPDQRAVLQLLVRQGKSHAEIAQMLGISQHAVADRAQAALDALAGNAGAQGAETIAGPAGGRGGREPARSGAPATVRGERPPASPPPQGAPAQAPGPAARRAPAPRRAGALLLVGLAIAIVLAVVLIANGSGGGSHNASSGSTAKSTGKSGTPRVEGQLRLASPDPSSSAVGVVELLSQGSQHAFFVVAQNLPPSKGFFYAVWLYNSPSRAQVLGKAPTVTANGRLQAVGPLPANARSYRKMLITRETTEQPTRPGPIVLSGPFKATG